MKIKFLGTCSGKTTLYRNHTSFLIFAEDHTLLVECGDGVSRALLSFGINYNAIDSILISHLHADHFSGLPSLITQMKLHNRTRNLILYIHESNKNFIEDFIYHSYLFRNRLGFELMIKTFGEDKSTINDKFSFFAKLNSHLRKYSESIDKIEPFPSTSFLFDVHQKKIIYTGDIGSSQDLKLFNQKVDLLITEATHIILDEIKEISSNPDFNKIILTHYDDNLEKDFKFLLTDPDSGNFSNISLASDGLELSQF